MEIQLPIQDPIARKKYHKQYRLDNPGCDTKSAEKCRQYAAEKRRKMWKIKSERGCARCPERDPRCLDFHHRDKSTKSFTIGKLTRGLGWVKLLEEIAKCECLCANCHRKEEMKDLY